MTSLVINRQKRVLSPRQNWVIKINWRKMIRAGIVGISGYSGGLTFELLLNHPDVRVTYVSANNTKGPIAEIWPQLAGRTDLICDEFNSENAIELCDFVFLAVPHTVSLKIVPILLKAQKKVLDLSADYRLKNALDYLKWYGVNHSDAQNLTNAVYGLPELYREDIKKAALVANPGCYPTAAILALAPLVSTSTKSIKSITIDAKSGVTGAGRKVTASMMFSEVHENFKAYKVLKHQHTPEIDQYLTKLAQRPVKVTFVAHLLPINRGILETIYVQMDGSLSETEILSLYKKFYKTEPFLRVLPAGLQPEIRNVVGTNYCDLGIALSEDKTTLVITSAIDNLMKGAAGQAVQNMNIMCSFKENEALV